jgi:hypothetical protein
MTKITRLYYRLNGVKRATITLYATGSRPAYTLVCERDGVKIWSEDHYSYACAWDAFALEVASRNVAF